MMNNNNNKNELYFSLDEIEDMVNEMRAFYETFVEDNM